MAHLGAACFSGPHSYSLPGGSVQASYHVHRVDGVLHMSIKRQATGFTAFSLPDEEAHACHDMSFCRQSADLLLECTDGGVVVQVLSCGEALRLVWPDGRAVVQD